MTNFNATQRLHRNLNSLFLTQLTQKILLNLQCMIQNTFGYLQRIPFFSLVKIMATKILLLLFSILNISCKYHYDSSFYIKVFMATTLDLDFDDPIWYVAHPPSILYTSYRAELDSWTWATLYAQAICMAFA